MDTRLDDLYALTGDEVGELFGWPVSLLDKLAEIRESAESEEITLQEWRRQDAELRAVGPAQFAHDQIETTCRAIRKALVDDDTADADEERLLLLLRRLRALANAAPDDDAIRQQFTRLRERIAEETMPAIADWLRETQARLRRWLVASGSIDERSGLP